ncbi:hypothetical protein [Vibrio sp. ZOR0018]|uniref:hypothetical protein n=1 Tax=Vibrio sp. ZOR0018 TaxID=1339225 RepID=UPI0006474DE5|nr:hypothetical protein [Vibrio sp. ZOR0018]
MEILEYIIGLLGGGTVVLAALFAFISKIWISRIVETNKAELQKDLLSLKKELDSTNKKLDAELQSATYISQVQLEHEYKVYRDIWASLVELKSATMHLRPFMDYVDPNQSQEDRIRERLQPFVVKFNEMYKVLEHNKPFYPQDIYEALDRVCEKCRHESIDSEYIECNNAEYYKEAQTNRREIIDLISSACDAIRNRLNEVKVK